MSLTHRLADHIDTRLASPAPGPLYLSRTPESYRQHLQTHYVFTKPQDLETVFEDVVAFLRDGTEHATHPMYFGLFRPMVERASIIADALASVYDPNLAVWDFTPAAIEMEQHVLHTIAGHFGIDMTHGLAQFTSGGQESNHTAVAVALTHHFPGIAEKGLRSLPGQPVFYLSAEGHHSLDKVAHSTGLGRNACRFIPVDAAWKMDLAALEAQIAKDRQEGFRPFMVVGTAGTTSAGTIDPLPELATLAQRENMWFHVDAAWGGAAALSLQLSPTLTGIEQADSITCDAHKWLSVPVGAGMFFCKHRASVEATFATHTAYVPAQALSDRVHPFITSMQWSRRFMGLKVFMMFAQHGLTGIAARLEHQTAMGDYLRTQLTETGWHLINHTPLPVICFTPDRSASATDLLKIIDYLKRDQTAWISKTTLGQRQPVLRACITNYQSKRVHVDRLVAALNEARAALFPDIAPSLASAV